MGGLQRFERQAGAGDLRRLRQGLPQRGAAGRDRGRAAARVRQQRPDPVPRPADGAQRLPRRARADRPRPALAVRHRRWRATSPSSSRTTPSSQGYQFPGPIRDRVRGGRGPHHRPVPDPQQRARRRCQSNATRTQAQRARAFVVAGGQQHPLHPPATVVGRGTEADIRVNDPGVSRRHIEFQLVRGRRRTCRSGCATSARPTACWSTATGSPAPALRDGSEVKIGNTTLTVRIVTEAAQGAPDV